MIKKLLFAFLLLLPSVSFANNGGYLPKDLGNNIIQGSAPDVFSSKTITGSGLTTLNVTKDITVRFKANYDTTYSFGTGTPWPVPANTEEFVIVPSGVTSLTINSSVNPTTVYIQEGRK